MQVALVMLKLFVYLITFFLNTPTRLQSLNISSIAHHRDILYRTGLQYGSRQVSDHQLKIYSGFASSPPNNKHII